MGYDNRPAQDMIGLPVNEFYKRSGPSQMSDSVKGPELGHLIKALATDPNVVAFGWDQYTPYFNDGDVCEFGVGELWVKTVLDTEDGDRWELNVNDWHPTLGKQIHKRFDLDGYDRYGRRNYEYRTLPNEPKFPQTYELADSLATAIQMAEVTLLEWFGDHAEIRVTAAGVEVSEYEHD